MNPLLLKRITGAFCTAVSDVCIATYSIYALFYSIFRFHNIIGFCSIESLTKLVLVLSTQNSTFSVTSYFYY